MTAKIEIDGVVEPLVVDPAFGHSGQLLEVSLVDMRHVTQAALQAGGSFALAMQKVARSDRSLLAFWRLSTGNPPRGCHCRACPKCLYRLRLAKAKRDRKHRRNGKRLVR